MNVRTICLAILYDADATGYEIRKLSTEGEYCYFVDASYGAIYPALQKLEADRLVTSKVAQQDGKPAKKIYAITEAGRRAFVASLHEPLGEEVFRSPFLLFARYAHLLPASLVESRLQEQLDSIREKRRHLEEIRDKGELTPGDAWVLRHGLTCMQVVEQEMTAHMHELIAQARPEPQAADAAE